MNNFGSLHGAAETREKVRDIVDRMAANDPKLASVVIARLDLTAADAAEIGTALRSSAHLTHLALYKTNIGDDGARALREALSSGNNSSLAQLNLSCNGIGDDGATALAEALSSGNSSLEKLVLWNNRICADGATAFAEALARNSSLAQLNLWDNDIGNDGAKALGGALARNSTLAALHLSGNEIGEDGLRALAGALSANAALTFLGVDARSDNERACKEEMDGLLQRNKNEQELMRSWPRGGFISSCPVLLHAAGKFCGLRTVYRLFRERPDILIEDRDAISCRFVPGADSARAVKGNKEKYCSIQ